MPRFGEAPGFTADDRTNLEAILVDTGTTLDAALAVIDANIDAILVDTGTTLDALIRDIVALSDAPAWDTYPTLAPGVTLSSTNQNFVWGSWTEILPVNTITEDFWLFGALLDYTLAANFFIELGTGGAGAETAVARLGVDGSMGPYGAGTTLPVPRKIPANTRVSGRLATAGTTVRDLPVWLTYATGL